MDAIFCVLVLVLAHDRVGRLFVSPQTTEFKSKMSLTRSNCARSQKYASCIAGYIDGFINRHDLSSHICLSAL